MNRLRRRLALIATAACVLVLLPVATNVATSGLPDVVARNARYFWAVVLLLGLVAVFVFVRAEERAEQEPRRHRSDPAREHGPEFLSDADADPPRRAASERSSDSSAWLPPQQTDEPEPELQDDAPVLVETLPEKVRGRERLLNELAVHLREGGLVVLTGAGGMGKSTVARELIRRNRPHNDPVQHPPAWEMSGSGLRTLVHDARVVARSLGAGPGALAAIEAPRPAGPDHLWQVLETGPPGWVLIVDNADDIDVLAKPAGPDTTIRSRLAEGTGWVRTARRGLVIVTSRQREKRHWPPGAKIYKVPMLSKAAAARILLDLAPTGGGRSEAEALADRLGRLPLALRLAGLYLGSNYAYHHSFDAYRAALEQDPTAIRYLQLHDTDPEAAERAMVMFTWELSLDALARKGLPQARPLLRLLSCYAPAVTIPLSLLGTNLVDEFLSASVDVSRNPGAPAPRVDHVLKGLDQLGLIDPIRPRAKRRSDGTTVSPIRGLVVHPVVADTNRAYLVDPRPGDPPEPLIRQTAVELLATALDGMVDQRPSAWSTYEALTPHLQALLSNSAPRLGRDHFEDLIRMAGDIGEIYGHMKRPESGIELISVALKLGRKRGLDAEHALLRTRQQLAGLFGSVGRHAEAESIYRDVLDIYSGMWPRDDLVNLVARHNVAVAVGNQGRWDEAEMAYRDLLADERRTVGDSDARTRNTRLGYAMLLIQQGRLDAAEKAIREILSEVVRVSGADHQFALILRYNLAAVLRRRGRQEEVQEARGDLAGDARRVLGEDHLFTAATERSDEDVLFSEVMLSGPDLHDELAVILLNKGARMSEAGQQEQALVVFEDVVRRFADDHSAIIREVVGKALFNQAMILAKLDRVGDAVTAYDQLVSRVADDDPSTMHGLAAEALVNKAILLQRQPELALSAIEQAIAWYQELAVDSSQSVEAELAAALQIREQIRLVAASVRLKEADTLHRRGRGKEAIAKLDALVVQYGDDTSPQMREMTAQALFKKGVILSESGGAES